MRLIGLAVVLAISMFLVPLAAEAQRPGKVYRIGYLSGNPQADTQEAIEAFIDAMRVKGRNLAIERRYVDGNYDRLQRLVEELIQYKVDVILTLRPASWPSDS